MRKKGIAVAGNMIVDMLYPIDGFPKPGELTTITALYRLPMKNRAAKRSFRFVALVFHVSLAFGMAAAWRKRMRSGEMSR